MGFYATNKYVYDCLEKDLNRPYLMLYVRNRETKTRLKKY